MMNKKITILILVLAVMAVVSGCSKKVIENSNNEQIVNQGQSNKQKVEDEKIEKITTLTNNDNSQEIENQKNQEQETEEIIIPTDKIDISDWQTYRNEVSDYELKHPNSWNCREEKGEIIVDSIIYCVDESKHYEKQSGTKASICVNSFFSEDIKNPINYLKKIRGDSMFGTPTPNKLNYRIAGVDGVRLSYKEGMSQYDTENEGITIVFIKNYKVFHIYIHVDNDGTQKNNIEKILQSLKVE